MAVTYSAGVITVTGTETSLANFAGLTGVTTTALGNKTLYVLDTARLVVTGSLIIDPDVECLYLKDNVAYPCITYNGTLQIGRKRTSGSRILYSTGDAIIIGRQATTDFDTDTYAGICSKANGSSFIGYGGSIKTKSPVSFGGTLNTKYTGSVNIESIDMFQGAAANAAAAQVRFDLSTGQTINVKGLRLSCDVDNVTLRNVILFATNFTSFAAQFAAFTLQNFSSSSVDLTFDNLEFANNYVSYDIFGNSANNVAITPIYTLRNTDVGTATRAWGNTNTDAVRMNWLFTQVVTATLLDAAGSPITANAGLYINETDDGNRFQPEQGRSGFTWTTVESYTPTPNGSGIATATVRTGIKKWYGLTSPLTTTISQSYFGKSSADDFDIYFYGYLFLSAVRTETLRGTGGTSFNWAQLSDPYVTQTNRTTVNAYTSIDFCAYLYDRYKSWKSTVGNLLLPTILTQHINGGGLTLSIGDCDLVVDSAAASAFAIVTTGDGTITIKTDNLQSCPTFPGGLATDGDGTIIVKTNTEVSSNVNGSIELEGDAVASGNVTVPSGQHADAPSFDNFTGALNVDGTLTVAAIAEMPADGLSGSGTIIIEETGSLDLRGSPFDGTIENGSGGTLVILRLPTDPALTLAGTPAPTVDNSIIITISAPNLLEDSVVLLKNVTQDTEIDAAVVGISGYSVSLTSGVDYDIDDELVLLAGYSQSGVYKQVFRAGFTAGSSNVALNDSQADWVEPNSHSFDGSTVAECATDYANVEVDVDDADNSTTKLRIALFITDAIATANGLRNWVSNAGVPALRWLENGKAAIDTTVMAIYVNNAKAASTLSVEDSFAFIWSDGVTRARAVLGSSIIWKANTEAIVVAVGSGVLPADITAIAAAVEETSTALRLGQFIALK
jgi:hypothetical protein